MGNNTSISKPFATGDINSYSRESAWWAFNFAANYANTRYSDIVIDIKKEQSLIENYLIKTQDSIEQIALSLPNPARIEFLSHYSDSVGKVVHSRWVALGDRLVTKYNDGYIKNDKNQIKTKGYPKEWLEFIIEQDGDRFKIDE